MAFHKKTQNSTFTSDFGEESQPFYIVDDEEDSQEEEEEEEDEIVKPYKKRPLPIRYDEDEDEITGGHITSISPLNKVKKQQQKSASDSPSTSNSNINPEVAVVQNPPRVAAAAAAAAAQPPAAAAQPQEPQLVEQVPAEEPEDNRDQELLEDGK